MGETSRVSNAVAWTELSSACVRLCASARVLLWGSPGWQGSENKFTLCVSSTVLRLFPRPACADSCRRYNYSKQHFIPVLKGAAPALQQVGSSATSLLWSCAEPSRPAASADFRGISLQEQKVQAFGVTWELTPFRNQAHRSAMPAALRPWKGMCVSGGSAAPPRQGTECSLAWFC